METPTLVPTYHKISFLLIPYKQAGSRRSRLDAIQNTLKKSGYVCTLFLVAASAANMGKPGPVTAMLHLKYSRTMLYYKKFKDNSQLQRFRHFVFGRITERDTV